jgi:hypothetical protein
MAKKTGRTAVIFLYWRSQFWLDAVTMLIGELKSDGVDVLVVDSSHLHRPRQAPWSIGNAKFSNSGVESVLNHYFSSIGATFRSFPDLKGETASLDPSDREALQIAVKSSMNNTFRSSFLGGFSYFERFIWNSWMKDTSATYLTARSLLQSLRPDEVFVTNGRLSSQRAISLACERLEVRCRFLEHSEFPGSLFNRPYRPHDRLAFQVESSNTAMKMSADEIQTKTELWVGLRRKSGSVTNPFNSRWRQGAAPQEMTQGSAPVALFLTSSSDEFESLDLDWKEGSWSSQYEAFEQVWQELKYLGFKPVLRIHPNLGNKNFSDAKQEMQQIASFHSRNPDFQIVGHNSRLSTYELLARSKVVVVYNSTVGLEASLEGRHTLTLNSCWYDNSADVLKVHSLEDLRNVGPYLDRDIDPTGAKHWVASQAKLDAPVSKAPQQLLGRGTLPIQLVRALLDGSLLWLIYEKRWPLNRLATKLLGFRTFRKSEWKP